MDTNEVEADKINNTSEFIDMFKTMIEKMSQKVVTSEPKKYTRRKTRASKMVMLR